MEVVRSSESSAGSNPSPDGRQVPKQRTPLSRRASCRDATTTEKSPAFERSGSLRALPSLPPRGLRRGSLLTPGSLGEVAHTHLDGGAHATHGAPMASNTKNSSNSPSNNNNNNNAPNNA